MTLSRCYNKSSCKKHGKRRFWLTDLECPLPEHWSKYKTTLVYNWDKKKLVDVSPVISLIEIYIYLTFDCSHLQKKLYDVIRTFAKEGVINGRVGSALAPRLKGRGFKPRWFQKSNLTKFKSYCLLQHMVINTHGWMVTHKGIQTYVGLEIDYYCDHYFFN